MSSYEEYIEASKEYSEKAFVSTSNAVMDDRVREAIKEAFLTGVLYEKERQKK